MPSSFLAASIPLGVLLITALVVLLRARRKKTSARPAREASAFVILESNMWDACTVDDVREPWARLTTEPIRGFCGVTPGRHRIRTSTSAGEATLDFVVYPGEVLAWKLDAERARWEPHDLDPDTRSSLESAPVSTLDLAAHARPKMPGWLVHLRTTVGLVSSRGNAPSIRGEGEGIERVRKRLAKLVARAEEDDEEADDLLSSARGLGEAIIGKPLTRKDLRGFVACVRDVSSRLAARGHVDRAMSVVLLGLAVLPGDPELMVAAGVALAARGESDEALRALNAALERDRCLDANDVARAMRTRLELRTSSPRGVRV